MTFECGYDSYDSCILCAKPCFLINKWMSVLYKIRIIPYSSKILHKVVHYMMFHYGVTARPGADLKRKLQNGCLIIYLEILISLFSVALIREFSGYICFSI